MRIYDLHAFPVPNMLKEMTGGWANQEFLCCGPRGRWLSMPGPDGLASMVVVTDVTKISTETQLMPLPRAAIARGQQQVTTKGAAVVSATFSPHGCIAVVYDSKKCQVRQN